MAFAKPVVVGNWKMNGLHGEAEALAAALVERRSGMAGGTLGVCPPATAIATVRAALGDADILLGGQDCSPEQKGAFTGDVSAPMLKDAGCQVTIVGHSERRHGHGESDELVRAKAEAALGAGLIVILCIGETEAQWEAGETLGVLDRQLRDSVPDAATADTLIIAYEPVWAIGTGRTPTSEDIAKTHLHIRGRLRERFADGDAIRIQYGGSVKGSNAVEILGTEGVDGALVGGASLDAADFWAIFEAGRAAAAA